LNHTVEEVVLKNGARGLFINVPGATVMSSQFHFRAGSRFVRDKSIYETAHIMEHMAFGANATFADSHAYEAEFTRNGAYHNAYTSDNSMVYVSECADFEWDRILDLKKVAIVEPRFNGEELEGEKGNVKSELTGYLNNYNRLLWPKISQKMGEDILTYKERLTTIPTISLADIREHYQRTHTSHNMRFVIAGSLDGRRGKLLSMLEDWHLEPGERLPIPVDELHQTDAVMIRRRESSDVTFGLTFVAPRRLSDAELDGMAALNHILAGTLHSRVLGAARKKGLAYSMFADSTSYEHNSSWDFGSQLTLTNLDGFFGILLSELRQVLDGQVIEADLDGAKSYALGKHQMNFQSVGQISGQYADRYFFDGVIENFDRVPTDIAAITPDRIVAASRDFMQARCWSIGFVGDLDKVAGEALRTRVLEALFER